jgi:hypothetical protein
VDAGCDISYPPPYESLLDIPEEVAVFKGDDKWFEPTIPFDEGGELCIPNDLSPAYKPIISRAQESFSRIHPAIVRLRVLFEGDGRKHLYFTTGFALSPTVVFTDFHCVPPTATIYEKGSKIAVPFKSVQARWDVFRTHNLHYNSSDTIPLELVTRENDLKPNTSVQDPISNQLWKRARGNADLAVLRVPEGHPFKFTSYFFPATSEKVY